MQSILFRNLLRTLCDRLSSTYWGVAQVCLISEGFTGRACPKAILKDRGRLEALYSRILDHELLLFFPHLTLPVRALPLQRPESCKCKLGCRVKFGIAILELALVEARCYVKPPALYDYLLAIIKWVNMDGKICVVVACIIRKDSNPVHHLGISRPPRHQVYYQPVFDTC